MPQHSKRKVDRPPTHREDPIVSIPEVGRQIGKDKKTVAMWCRSGLMECVRMPGGQLGVRISEVNKILEASPLHALVKSPTNGKGG